MQYLIVIQVNFTVNKMKLVKPQVSVAVAIPQIYADLIQHKELFKYYIAHFWMILDIHPPPVTVF